MKRNRVTNELSEQLKAELKAVPLVSAPNELWTRVSTELSSGADELKVKYFPYRRALATAASFWRDLAIISAACAASFSVSFSIT